jgi:trans-4-hydroxy-L-proline dehydratase
MKNEKLKKDVMARGGSFIEKFNPFLRNYVHWKAISTENSPVEIRGRLLLELVKRAPLEIRPDWTLAGEHMSTAPGAVAPENPEENYQRLVAEEKIDVAFADIQDLLEGYTSRASFLQSDAPGKYCGWNFTGTDKVYSARGWIENHSIRDYAKLLRLGFGGIKKEIEAQAEKTDFLKAATNVCDAGILLGKRYAELARKQGLDKMAEICERVPEHGATNFKEAVQALWFGHILTCGEDFINANSLGRIDQILYPYYAKDNISRAAALDLMEELACKLYLDYDVQAITLGGIKADGECAINELSYIILEATENMGFIRDLSVRVNSKTPVEFIEKCSNMIIRGGGIPFIFNDDAFVKALTDRGIKLEDARDYAPIGCVEITIPGKANPHAVSGWFNSTKCLELALFDGVDPGTGKQLGPHTGKIEDFSLFEQLYEAYDLQVKFFAENMVKHCNDGESAQQKSGPLPCWSILTDDCIKRGRDITDGGPIYNYHSICFMGAPDTADALYALKKTLFEEKSVSTEELLTALKADWSGHETLRQKLLNLPKYGNDIDEVDAICEQLSDDFISLMDEQRSPLDGRYFVHLFTFKLNIPFGKAIGAMPDGRMVGVPLAYSLSAHQGRDQDGLTAMLKSLSKQPHNRAAGGSAAIIDIHPSLLSDKDGGKLLTSLITSALSMGVGQIQFNVTSIEQLERAQNDPENYGNIPIRVAGYSQMFKLLDPELQNHIIARHKHTG